MFEKASGMPGSDGEQAVVGASTSGWIDAVRRSLDAQFFVQRFTPRRAGGTWSQKNSQPVERLIAGGLLQPPRLAHVLAAQAYGRWDTACAGPALMQMGVPQRC